MGDTIGNSRCGKGRTLGRERGGEHGSGTAISDAVAEGMGAGSKQALDQLMPLVYDELRTLAETLHGDPT